MNIPKIQINSLYLSGLLLLVYTIGETDDITAKSIILSIYCVIFIVLVVTDKILIIGSSNKLPSKKDFVFVWAQPERVFLYTRFILEKSELDEISQLNSVKSIDNWKEFVSIDTKKIFFKKEVEAQISAILEKRKLINQ